MEGVRPKEEEIPASPITPGDQANAAEQQSPPGLNAAGLNAADALSPEEQIEPIEADNAFAVQLQAHEHLVSDNALARQLLEPHSSTIPRQWPAIGQIPEAANTPGACGSRDTQHPDPNDPAGHLQPIPGSNRRSRVPKDDPGHLQQRWDTGISSDTC